LLRLSYRLLSRRDSALGVIRSKKSGLCQRLITRGSTPDNHFAELNDYLHGHM
jgi:hypothetical protein